MFPIPMLLLFGKLGFPIHPFLWHLCVGPLLILPLPSPLSNAAEFEEEGEEGRA